VENVYVPSAGKAGPSRRPARGIGSESARSSYSLRACSNCAGDYEDPDRTAWTDDEEIEPGEGEAAEDGAQAE